jgi:hypothetical protein
LVRREVPPNGFHYGGEMAAAIPQRLLGADCASTEMGADPIMGDPPLLSP